MSYCRGKVFLRILAHLVVDSGTTCWLFAAEEVRGQKSAHFSRLIGWSEINYFGEGSHHSEKLSTG